MGYCRSFPILTVEVGSVKIVWCGLRPAGLRPASFLRDRSPLGRLGQLRTET